MGVQILRIIDELLFRKGEISLNAMIDNYSQITKEVQYFSCNVLACVWLKSELIAKQNQEYIWEK